jgi:hypothetical protein
MNSKELKSFEKIKTIDESLFSVIIETIVSIDSLQNEVLIPNLLQDYCQEFDVNSILKDANLIKNAIIGKELSSIDLKQNYFYKTTNIFSSDGDRIGSDAFPIINQINSLKNSLKQFKVLLNDLKVKYEQSVNSLTEKKD